MAIRAVLFDLFDTLVDLRFEKLPRLEHQGRWISPSTGELHAAACARAQVSYDDFALALLEVDGQLREERTVRGLETTTHERFAALAARLGIEDPELPGILTAVHMGMLRDTVSVPEHHADLLARLGRRVRLGLCSNFSHSATAVSILEEAGMLVHLEAVAISDEVGYRKPRGEIFDAVLRELAVAPEECLHVGDNLRADVAGAAEAGLRTAWITRRVTEPERRLDEFDGPRPDWCIRDLAELPPLIARGEIS